MATVDLGKIKFTWKGAFATSTTYEADDVVSSGGSSWIYVNATPKTGTNAGTPATSNSSHWNLMADGATPLTTAGDVMSHSGSSTTRVPIGASGSVLTAGSNSVSWIPSEGYTGHKVLLKNYGSTPANHNASNTYGADGKYPWLANYAQGWIPECGTPNPSMSPVMQNDVGIQNNGYRMITYLNQNHELMTVGDDDYFWMGTSSAQKHSLSVCMNFSQEFGGMADGDYPVRHWISYNSIYLLTAQGDLFCAGYNGYGQLGVGGTVDRYTFVKISTLGQGATHGGVSCKIAGFHLSNQTDSSAYNYTSCYAIDTSGRLFVWGYNLSGKLGIGNATNQSLPVLASGVSNVVSVTAGHGHALAVTTAGDLFYTGADTNGVAKGTAVTSWTDTSENNVYQVLCADGYYGGSNRQASNYYLNTSGEMYAIGLNGNGQLGIGSTATTSAYTRVGGSLTFSSFYVCGDPVYGHISAIGGTPSSPNYDYYNWGYNVSGHLGQGNVTALTTPTQPQTTTLYTTTTASTSSNTAPTTTAVSFPVNDIYRVYPQSTGNGTTSAGMYLIDNKGRLWGAGYGNDFDLFQNITASAVSSNFYLDPSPMNTTQTIGSYHWAGKTEIEIDYMWSTGNRSEGLRLMVTTDGRIWGKGYNGQGQLSDGALSYYGQWQQITP